MSYWVTILSITGLNIVLALSVYVTLATGQFSLAQVGFWAIGAYAVAILTTLYAWALLPALAIGAVLAAVLGAVLAWPCLRIRGIYLALATLGFSETVRVFFLNFRHQVQVGDRVLGPDGVLGFRNVVVLTEPWHIALAVVLTLLLLLWIERSRAGLSLAAVQDDEVAAAAMGIDVVAVKVAAFALGAAIAAIGGGLYAGYMSYITAQDFGFSLTMVAVVFVAIGGIGSVWGPVLGATLLTLLPEQIRFLQEYRMIFYGLLVLVIMVLRPRGLIDRDVIAWIAKRVPRLKERAS